MQKDRILVFIPAYNCAGQIVRVLKQFDREIINYINEIIVVNNRSTDNTEQIVKDYLTQHPELPCRLLRNNENYNLGGSHKVAFNYAVGNGFDYVIVLHGDDQGNIKDFLPLLKEKIYREYDCCLGARFKKGSRLEGYSKIRIMGNHVFNRIFSWTVRKRIYDLGSGLNMFKTETLKSGYYIKFPDTLHFNECLVMAICRYNQKYMFYPISWREDDQISNFKLARYLVLISKMIFGYLKGPDKFLSSDMTNGNYKKGYGYECIFSNGVLLRGEKYNEKNTVQ